MKVRERLNQHLEEQGLGTPDGWFGVRLFGKRIRLFPQGPLAPLLTSHDLHHLYTGYGTHLGGEAEVVAWEISSGGFGKYWFAWLDIGKVLVLAMLFPKRFRAAWIRGRQSRNLYGQDLEQVLEWEWSVLVKWVESPSLPPSRPSTPSA